MRDGRRQRGGSVLFHLVLGQPELREPKEAAQGRREHLCNRVTNIDVFKLQRSECGEVAEGRCELCRAIHTVGAVKSQVGQPGEARPAGRGTTSRERHDQPGEARPAGYELVQAFGVDSHCYVQAREAGGKAEGRRQHVAVVLMPVQLQLFQLQKVSHSLQQEPNRDRETNAGVLSQLESAQRGQRRHCRACALHKYVCLSVIGRIGKPVQAERVHPVHGMYRVAAHSGLSVRQLELAVDDMAVDQSGQPLGRRAPPLLEQRQL